ncbi:MAG: DUF2310 family Zn-ribbon-containing protein [Planctomycetes bacterium]|nr:DUF2310 family Zn-ribbon-containing protein [Planctomycetota bacterium]
MSKWSIWRLNDLQPEAQQQGHGTRTLDKPGSVPTRQRIEEVSGVSTYHSLARLDEQPRSPDCPGCSSPWRLEAPWQRLFSYRCDPCRLLCIERS